MRTISEKLSHSKEKRLRFGEVAHYLRERGVPAESMNIGGTIELDGVSFTMTPAVHSSRIEDESGSFDGGAAAGFVIRMDGVSVYHAGDTALFSDMKLIGELCHPDIALIPIGGRYTMGTDAAMMAAQFIGAKTVVPIHYNTWDRIAADPLPFKKALERTADISVRILKPGESMDCSPGTVIFFSHIPTAVKMSLLLGCNPGKTSLRSHNPADKPVVISREDPATLWGSI